MSIADFGACGNWRAYPSNLLLTVCLILLIATATSFAGCTLVYIQGDANTISDTGGHGGVTLPAAPTQPTLADRLHGLNANKH